METNISTHTLFHFTYNKNSLLSILKNGLYVRYSLENFESLINNKAEIVFIQVPIAVISSRDFFVEFTAVHLWQLVMIVNHASSLIL